MVHHESISHDKKAQQFGLLPSGDQPSFAKDREVIPKKEVYDEKKGLWELQAADEKNRDAHARAFGNEPGQAKHILKTEDYKQHFQFRLQASSSSSSFITVKSNRISGPGPLVNQALSSYTPMESGPHGSLSMIMDISLNPKRDGDRRQRGAELLMNLNPGVIGNAPPEVLAIWPEEAKARYEEYGSPVDKDHLELARFHDPKKKADLNAAAEGVLGAKEIWKPKNTGAALHDEFIRVGIPLHCDNREKSGLNIMGLFLEREVQGWTQCGLQGAVCTAGKPHGAVAGGLQQQQDAATSSGQNIQASPVQDNEDIVYDRFSGTFDVKHKQGKVPAEKRYKGPDEPHDRCHFFGAARGFYRHEEGKTDILFHPDDPLVAIAFSATDLFPSRMNQEHDSGPIKWYEQVYDDMQRKMCAWAANNVNSKVTEYKKLGLNLNPDGNPEDLRLAKTLLWADFMDKHWKHFHGEEKEISTNRIVVPIGAKKKEQEVIDITGATGIGEADRPYAQAYQDTHKQWADQATALKEEIRSRLKQRSGSSGDGGKFSISGPLSGSYHTPGGYGPIIKGKSAKSNAKTSGPSPYKKK